MQIWPSDFSGKVPRHFYGEKKFFSKNGARKKWISQWGKRFLSYTTNEIYFEINQD